MRDTKDFPRLLGAADKWSGQAHEIALEAEKINKKLKTELEASISKDLDFVTFVKAQKLQLEVQGLAGQMKCDADLALKWCNEMHGQEGPLVTLVSAHPVEVVDMMEAVSEIAGLAENVYSNIDPLRAAAKRFSDFIHVAS